MTTKIDIYQPMTKSEFNRRIDQSMEDSKKRNLIRNDELKSEIERWEYKTATNARII